MLLELGVEAVVLGHSERRQHFAETDAALARKVPKALDAGLLPILCVGETEEEREAGETERKLRHQVQSDLAAVDVARLPEVVIAYEPIWAIGTGKTATPEQAQAAIGFVRALVSDRDAAAAQAVRVLYGGSVDAANAAELMGLRGRRRRPRRGSQPEPGQLPVDRGGCQAVSEAVPGRSRPAAALRRARGPRRLGPRSGRPGQRRLAGRHAGVRRPVARVPAHAAGRLRARRSGCRPGRWGTPRSAT